jgi:hypothetical protein
MWYTDNRTIDIEIPDGTEDIEVFVKNYIEENEDEIEDDFMDADVEDEFSDPEHLYYTIEDDKGEKTEWQDY